MEYVKLHDIGVVDYERALEIQTAAFDALVGARKKHSCATVTAETVSVSGACGQDKEDSTDNTNRTTTSVCHRDTKLPDCSEAKELEQTADMHSGREETRNDISGAGKAEQQLFLCEHPHVYTLGLHGNERNMLVDNMFLEKIGAKYFRTNRGGDITYHGYGQLVGYPILDLERMGLSLKGYIEAIEEAVIACVAHYGIKAGRLHGATGVWIDAEDEQYSSTGSAIHTIPEETSNTSMNPGSEERGSKYAEDGRPLSERHCSHTPVTAGCPTTLKTSHRESGIFISAVRHSGKARKICAIGVRASHHVTMHGFALNVNTDLSYFSHINPCGFEDKGVTSIEKEIGHKVDMQEVKEVFARCFEKELKCKLK